MKVLLVVDDRELGRPSNREQFDTLRNHLDPTRIELVTCALGHTAQPIGGQDNSLESVTDLRVESRHTGLDRVTQLRQLLRVHGVEVVHILDQRALWSAKTAARLVGIPCIASVSDMGALLNLFFVRWRMQVLHWWLKLSWIDRVVVPFELVRQKLAQMMPTRAARVEVVYPCLPVPLDDAVPTREALYLPGTPLVALMPSAQPDPGNHIITEMLPRLLKRQPQATLVVIGSGPGVLALQREASAVRPALPIRWIDGSADAWGVVSNCDVVIDCSSHEQEPRGLMLAALAGRPIVATRSVVSTEIVESNVSGLLVTANDPSDMAVQVGRLLQYDGLSHRLGRMARRRALERYTISAQISAMTRLYESTVYASR